MTAVRPRRRAPRNVTTRRFGRWPIVVGAVLAVLVACYAVPAVVLAGEIPPRTTVAGVDIGGYSPESAERVLARELQDEATRPLILRAGKKTLRLSPRQAGLSIDTAATVADAEGSLSPAGVAKALFGSNEVRLRVKVDRERLDAAIANLAKRIDVAPRNGAIRFVGTSPRVTQPRNGIALDREAAAQAIIDAYPLQREVTLPTKVVPPQVSAAAVRRAAATARRAVAGPITLTNGGRSATVTPEMIAQNLRFVPDGKGGLRPRFNAKKVATEVQDKLVDGAQAPKDASFRIVKGKPVVVPHRVGLGVDAGALQKDVEQLITGGGSRTVQVSLTKAQPALTTEKARKLGIREKVSSYTTYYPCCPPRVTNIHRIADILNGHLVMPGETFSLNGIVGRRDKARGFVEAPMILNGRFVNDVGGGISQFVTTMFNAVFFGGFEDVQHTPHMYYISRYPAGRESTVSYPQPDFRWRNDSPYGVLITTSYTNTSVTVTFWSTKRYDIESQSSGRYNIQPYKTLTDSGPDCIPMEGAEGFSIDVWRIFKKNGKEVRREKFHTVYAPEPKLTCEKEKKE
ncbi:vancomycin resistance protein YoaR [Thermopolyspora flexuosa]|uniref:Vancomycin resistance protein YoaR n=1 Tax=Thermopolyspora flexuosa TaxID=103836 RepID=A0A543IUE4_9ACTN|nr:vancomycin resistance protein YoaR [Thermopolyspora flexuosa]